MKAEEKWARELRSFFASEGIDYGPSVSEYFLLRLARHVLRRERAAVRRARGKTIGWTTYSTDVVEEWCCRQDCEEAVRRSEGGCALARVVAVPRKGGRCAK